MKTIRVLIADDHSMVREGIKQLIELEEDIQVIGLVGNGQSCIEKIIEHKPDIVLLDINMPVMNGLEVLEHLQKNNIDVNVIILTIHNEVEYLLRAIDIGVKGYILKDSDSDLLIKAIRSVSQGESYIQPNMATMLLKRMKAKDREQKVKSRLTKREIEVLKLITAGLLNREIAISLKISEKTVKNHVSNIFKKIEVNDRTQAAVYAIKNDIVTL